MVEVKIELVEKGFMPQKATEGSAAFDCYARSVKWHEDKGYLEIKLGFKTELPKGYVMKLYPRSSVTNRGMMLGNSVGIIDSDYRGEVAARFYPNASSIVAVMPNAGSSKALKQYCEEVYRVGEGCAQFIIEKLEDVELKEVESETISRTARGDGGFGSTDNNSVG